MDEKTFKKHLKDLAEGHHHPEEHDWGATAPAKKAPAKKASAKAAPPKRSAKGTKRSKSATKRSSK